MKVLNVCLYQLSSNYTTKLRLLTNMETHASQANDELLNNNRSIRQEPRDLNSQIKTCPYCKKTLKNERGLKQHSNLSKTCGKKHSEILASQNDIISVDPVTRSNITATPIRPHIWGNHTIEDLAQIVNAIP